MPTNERLRGSIAAAGLRLDDLADAVEVDAKTVARWVTTARQPHRRHRLAVARVLQTDESYLWPDTAADPVTRSASVAELLELHPSRSAVPHETWRGLMNGSHEALDVLAYAGSFLFEPLDLPAIVRAKAAQGVKVRIALGDPTSDAVAQRAIEEGTEGGLQGRIQLNLRQLRGMTELPGVEVRTHGTTLYNSLFRFDEDLLVNGHAYGAVAGQSPVLHLRRVPGGRMWDHYMRSFDEVWSEAQPHSS